MTGKEQAPPGGHRETVMAVRSPDGRTVVTGDHTGRLHVWDAGTGKLATALTLDGDLSGPPFAFSPDGKRFACAIQPGRVRLFDPATWKPAGEIELPGGDEAFVRNLGFLADGRFGFEGKIADRDSCVAAGGHFLPQAFGWMVHVYPFAGDDLKVAYGTSVPKVGATSSR